MLTYKKLQEELGGKEATNKSISLKSHKVMAFGRMNPITSGHEAVVNKVHEIAKKHNADHVVIVSHSQDAKKNPLSAEQKVKHAKNAFPGTNVQSASKDHPTILHHAAQAHATGAQHLHVVAGSDRHQAMHDLLHKYNGQHAAHGHYNFKSITVHSSGERDPDAEGTTGISASKMREHAASGNKEAFHAGAPSKMKPKHKDAMYNDVRKGMNIKEETIQETLRPDMGAGAYINDFIKSTDPRFNNKSRAERRRMAIGAYMAAKARGVKESIDESRSEHARTILHHTQNINIEGDHPEGKLSGGALHYTLSSKSPTFKRLSDKHYGDYHHMVKHASDEDLKQMHNDFTKKVNEEVQIDELSTDLLARYKTASAASAKAADVSGNYAKGDKRFKGINKATTKQFDNDLKKHSQMKEGTMQPNGTDQIETSTSAPTASTAKDTSMGKKIKGFKFFTGENDKQMNMNQPVKEAKDSHEYGYEGEMAMNQLKTLVRCAEMIEDMLKPDTDLPEWVQSKITLATDYIQTAADYLYSETEVKEGYSSYSGRSHGHAYGGGGFGKREREDDEYHVPDPVQSRPRPQAPVAPVPDRKYIKGTPENKAHKEANKSRTGHPTNEEVEQIDELSKDTVKKYKSYATLRAVGQASNIYDREVEGGKKPDPKQHSALEKTKKGLARADARLKEEEQLDEKSIQARRNKTYKNLMDASRGARYKLNNPVPDADPKHKTAQAHNKAIGRALRNEGTAQKGVNVDKVNTAGQEPHEEKFETVKKNISKLKKVKEETMKSYKEFLTSLDEKLIGGQKKLDKNKNGKLDKQDFEMLRKEEVELDESTYASAEQAKNVAAALKQKHNDGNYFVKQTKNGHKVVHAYHGDTKVKNDIRQVSEELERIEEVKMADLPSRKIQGKSYGANYEDPEGAFETKDDMKKPEKAGRKAGAGAGVYKPRKTMSKLKQLGATYK